MAAGLTNAAFIINVNGKRGRDMRLIERDCEKRLIN